ncbi:hypothetical protein HN415_10025 [Candidatus Woesearchaeota archaeon]|jgi:dolichol kinase|nr:hypothetical protein [Candidatus Woesearchaeota archaeon]
MSRKFELRRKIIHILFGIISILLLKYTTFDLIHVSLVLIIGIIVSFLSKVFKIPVISYFLKIFDRKKTKLPGQGSITFVFGIFLTMIFFGNNNILYAAIIILTLGDSFAAIIGVNLKKTKYLKKTLHPLSTEKLLEGTIVGIIIASLGSMLFVSIVEAIAASTIAMIIEGIEWKFNKDPIDDNILIPLAAASTIYLINILV